MDHLHNIDSNEVRPLVSVLICVRNAENYVSDCISSILQQNFTDFEIVIIDEFDSNDETKRILGNFSDKRLKYFKNKEKLGISKSRNLSIKKSIGDYLFFTDGDCILSPDWIEQGMLFLKRMRYAGVEGKTYYVSKDYTPTFSDHTYGTKPKSFMTNNIAYKREFVEKVGGFDERYTCHEDRDMGLMVLKHGNIAFNANMIALIQREILTPQKLLTRANAVRNRVYLFKKFHDKELLSWRILDVKNLIKILCPPSVFGCLLFSNFKSIDDYRLVPYTYISALLERLRLWRECAKERVFLI